jgi:curved DNA-binding protein CbpA
MESRKPAPKDYYAVLGVAPEADSAEIKKAYRALVQRYHPDRVQGTSDAADASERMVEINEAFAVLGDSKRRAEWERSMIAAKAPKPAASETVEEDWTPAVTPVKERIQTPSKRSSAVDKTLAKEFLEKVKAQVLQDEALSKFKDENGAGWSWVLGGKTWGTNYTIAVRQVALLNPNTAKELIAQLQELMDKRRSGWKYNYFVFLLAFDTLNEGDAVVKLFRTFAGRSEFSTAKNFVNVVVLDVNQRRSVLCGKPTSDATFKTILKALGAS